MQSSSCFGSSWKDVFCGPRNDGASGDHPNHPGAEIDGEADCGFDSDDGYEEDDEDYLDYCDSNKIVELTVRRELLLVELQELVDARTPQQAAAAIAAMDRESGNDDQLLRFLLRAGTLRILRNRLLKEDEDEGGPDESFHQEEKKEDDAGRDADAGASADPCESSCCGPILSPSAAQPLLEKLSYHHELRRSRLLEKKRQRSSWTRMVGIS